MIHVTLSLALTCTAFLKASRQSTRDIRMAFSFPDLLLLSSHLFSGFILTYLILSLLRRLFNTRRRIESTKYPPGSCGLPLIGETLAFIAANNSSKGVYEFVHTRHLKFGYIFQTNIFGDTHVFISSITAAKAILSVDTLDFSKRYIRSIAELLGDQSLLCASHDLHKLIRHHISAVFTADAISSCVKLFDELTVKTMEQWKQRESILVLDDAMKITFDAICRMLISLEEEHELEMLQKDVFEVSEAMLSLPFRLPGTRFYKGLKARKRIMKALSKKISSRRRGLEYHEDFLQSLLVKDESLSDDPLTDAQIMDNILTLIIAGQVTTASAIAWTVKYLDENQEVQDALRDAQSKLAPKVHGSVLGLEFLSEMPYASKVVKESLRMATIVSWFPRVALKDCQIEGFRIQKGWIVNIDARSIHLDPTLYHDPMKFLPSRFEEDTMPNTFLAFGMGGRLCLGMNLAKAMMLVFLYRLVTTYRWKVNDPDSSLEKWALFPRLRSGCPIHITPIGASYT